MKRSIGRILLFSVVFIILSSLSLYSCSSEPVTKWYYGEKAPDESLEANLGDYYFEYGCCNVYIYTVDGWEFDFCMKGEDGKDGKKGCGGTAGKDGATWLYGEVAPNNSDGNNGDCYLNTKKLTVYGKRHGKWYYKMKISDQRAYDYENDADGELKILCIGNSYSVDTMHYAYQILQDIGIEKVTLGNLYIAGCPIGTHYNNLKEDNAAYRYYHNDSGRWTETEGYTIKQALEQEDWDFISFQQRSGYSGKPSYYVNLQPLADEVRKIEPDATFLWNMTWAYQEGHDGLASNNYSSQMAMYNAIVDTVGSVILPNESFEFVSPVGTAIQNARTSHLGDTLNRDGTHLSFGVGRYTAALTFVGAITGYDISDVTWRPLEGDDYFKYPVSEAEQMVAIESAVNALKNPYSITESQHKEEP